MAYSVDAEQTPERALPAPASSVPAGQAPATSGRTEGMVIAIAHGFFEVSADGKTYLCTLRGRLRSSRPPSPPRRAERQPPLRNTRAPQQNRAQPAATEPAAVPTRIAPGDRVLFTDLGGGQGIIEDVLPRRTVLARARSEAGTEHIMLANLDLAVLVFAVREPTPHFGMLDRYLALCEHAGVAVTICLNKVDLGVPSEVEAAIALYAGLGYRVLRTSAATGTGLRELREQLQDRISLLTGPSGVGKSSLMNELVPDAVQRVGEISEATGKGRHTTTGVRLLPLPEGGWLADSAGIRELALWNVPSDELARAFIELRPVADDCLYEDCEHSTDEEGCALRDAVASGQMTASRFASFQRLFDEAREAEQPRW